MEVEASDKDAWVRIRGSCNCGQGELFRYTVEERQTAAARMGGARGEDWKRQCFSPKYLLVLHRQPHNGCSPPAILSPLLAHPPPDPDALPPAPPAATAAPTSIIHTRCKFPGNSIGSDRRSGRCPFPGNWSRLNRRRAAIIDYPGIVSYVGQETASFPRTLNDSTGRHGASHVDNPPVRPPHFSPSLHPHLWYNTRRRTSVRPGRPWSAPLQVARPDAVWRYAV